MINQKYLSKFFLLLFLLGLMFLRPSIGLSQKKINNSSELLVKLKSEEKIYKLDNILAGDLEEFIENLKLAHKNEIVNN